MTVHEWVQSARLRLAEGGVESADLEAQLLAAHVLLVDRVWLIAHSDEPFPELAGESILAARLAHKPLAYILGYREFFGRRFTVGPGVLIPRQETELLVEVALESIRSSADETLRLLDLGTGSGCIAVSLKLARPMWHVTASDISQSALEIADQNASDLGASIELVRSDAFEQFEGRRFDAIVTNPPYIGLCEPLSEEVKDFEPSQALFGGPTGMEFYELLANKGRQHLEGGGKLFMEVGYRQAQAVATLFAALGWTVVDIVPDLSGVSRVVVCSN